MIGQDDDQYTTICVPWTWTVSTPYGNITGIGVDVVGLNGAKTYQFRKIPYAKSPTGDLRFAKPQPFGNWNGTLDATSFGPSCMQNTSPGLENLLPNMNVSEDCLFLNIYLPNELDTSKKKSVLVWIHGGGYMMGQGMFYDGSYMAVKTDVIIVTINYRLNVFGFLTLGNNVMKGNYGIWDQIAALQWIQCAISSFGGDPDSVTIFGESAGGFSIGLLSLIPTNKGLFKRVIAQSGVSNSFLSTTTFGVQGAKEIGKSLQCNIHNSTDFLSCMKTKAPEDILHAANEADKVLLSTLYLKSFFAPVVDNELFSDLPENLLSNTSSEAHEFFQSLDIIVGNCNSEGSILLFSLTNDFQKQMNFNISRGIPYNVFCDNIVQSVVEYYYDGNRDIKDAICKKYRVDNDTEEQSRQALNMYTDLYFVSPSVATLQDHAISNTQTKRYMYIFTNSNDRMSEGEPHWFTGAGHGAELQYLFWLRSLSVKLNKTTSQEDLDLSNNLIMYWSNFAKTGDPNGATPSGSRTLWPEFSLESQSYLRLDFNITTEKDYRNNKMQFWLQHIPNLLHQMTTTVAPVNIGPKLFPSIHIVVSLFNLTIVLYNLF